MSVSGIGTWRQAGADRSDFSDDL